MNTAQRYNKLTNQIVKEERQISPSFAKIKKWEKQMEVITYKIAELCNIEGYDDSMDMMGDFAHDGVCPGICMNPDCDYTTFVEHNQDQGYCESCGTGTVSSIFILERMI